MSTNAKVLYVITKATWGGAQRYVYDLAVEAKKEGYDVAVAYGSDGILAEKLAADSIRTISLPSLGRDVKITKDFKVFFDLVSLFRRERPNIVHINSSKAGAIGALAARIARVPKIIFTAHGWAFNEERAPWQKGVIHFLSWLTIFFSHKTIVVSNRMHDQAPQFFVARKIHVIHNSIHKIHFYTQKEARAKLGLETLPHATLLLGTIGELHKNKGQEYLLESFAQVKNDFPNMHLCVIGRGEEEVSLKKKAGELGIEDSVTFTGFVDEAVRYLQVFDIFLLPSITEAFGYVLLEAGLAELPVIATRVGGIPEIIENDKQGLLVRPKDTKELALAIRFMLENKERRNAYAKALKEKVVEEFLFEKMCAKTFALY